MNRDLERAAEEFPAILTEHTEIFRMFKKQVYADAFFTYKRECAPTMKQIAALLEAEPESREELVDRCMDGLFAYIHGEEQKKKGLFRTDLLQGFKMDLALFAVPAILHMELPCSEEMADAIVDRWSYEYPQNRFIKGSFDEIAAGFHKGGSCYITTAVLHALGKPEDSEELAAFRNFRDTYLLNQAYGPAYVDAYYETAPGIVRMLAWETDPEQTYRDLWNRYLKPCLEAIQEGRMEDCEQGYVQMVCELERIYMPSLCHTSFLK